MEIGIMARHFPQPTLEGVLDEVVAHGMRHVQFSLSCAGCPELPEEIDPGLVERIRRETAARGIVMSAVSGTFNMIDPDVEKRRVGLRRLKTLAAHCDALGTRVISVCTGTRDPESMWRRHPDNDLPGAWADLLASMAEAVASAEESGVTLGVEPEVSNVVDSARKARRLMDEMQSPNLKIIIDGANLFHQGELPQMREILDEAFDLLGDDIVLAHAKDLTKDGEAGNVAAGTGLLDYRHYLSLLRGSGYDGAIILHSLSVAQVDGCVAFLRNTLSELG